MGCGVDKTSVRALDAKCCWANASSPQPSCRSSPGNFTVAAHQPGPDRRRSAADVADRPRSRGCAMRSKPVRDHYDVIIIDCPPSLNMLTLNALVAADSVLVPMQCEYYALEGLSALMATDRADPRERESRPAARRHPAHDVRPAQQPLQRGLGASCCSTSATRCSARSSRATCGWPRRRASASRCCYTTRIRAARWPTSRWPAR